LKNLLTIVSLLFLFFSQSNAQEFRLKNNIKIDAVGLNKRTTPSEEIKLENTPKLDEKSIAEHTKKIKPEPLKQFVLEQQTKAKDIMEKRTWMGEDVTNKSIQSNVSLGNVSTKHKQVKIEFRDFGLIDGDRIRIYLNEKVIRTNVVLDGNYFFVYITLEPGFNRIDIEALSEGKVGPNTAALNVVDDSGKLLTSNHWNLATNEIATLTVIKN